MRTWPGLAAIGAGIIHLGIAAGSPALLLIPLVIVGGTEVVWGVLALARPSPPAPLQALSGVTLVVGAWIVALLLPSIAHHAAMSVALPEGAMAGAALLDLAVGVLLAVHVRHRRPRSSDTGVVRFLVPAAVAALVVAVVTTASLAGTSVGGAMQMH